MRLLSALLLSAVAAWAVQECSVNGKYVNPSNGSTTAGVTGLMVCRENDRVVREEELRDGHFTGVRRFFESDGSVKESLVNEQGNRDGAYVEKDAQGVVRSPFEDLAIDDAAQPDRIAIAGDALDQPV